MFCFVCQGERKPGSWRERPEEARRESPGRMKALLPVTRTRPHALSLQMWAAGGSAASPGPGTAATWLPRTRRVAPVAVPCDWGRWGAEGAGGPGTQPAGRATSPRHRPQAPARGQLLGAPHPGDPQGTPQGTSGFQKRTRSFQELRDAAGPGPGAAAGSDPGCTHTASPTLSPAGPQTRPQAPGRRPVGGVSLLVPR